MSLRRLAKVAVDAPLSEALTYELNSEFNVDRGDSVLVPLGHRQADGVVLSVFTEDTSNKNDSSKKENTDLKIKPITALHSERPRLNDQFLKWLEWVSEYYLYPVGRTIQMCFPPLEKTKKERKSDRPPVIPIVEMKTQHILTDEQSICLKQINESTGFSTHLVHGVTGSGKTEIYLQLFEETLAAGKKGLFLLPEISLTPQLIQRFSEKFGDKIAALHSQLTDRERTNQWWDIVTGKKQILIGARSALFCPVDNVGLIVLDEEHEGSFKQDESLKYNGRDSAIMLGRFLNCKVILGSATPSLETWKNVQENKFKYHQLLKRVADRPMPNISVVDMRAEKDNSDRPKNLPNWLSLELYNDMTERLLSDQQVALLLNRRGVANMMFCQSCGHTIDCPNCDISLTLHAKNHLVCHYCDYHENLKTKCPDCKEGEMIPLGLGTEKVEADLKNLFPDKVVARADRDEVQSRLELEDLVLKMEQKEIDILIGTQMIAKGLDFSNLNLVGLLLVDIGFNLPDFRAAEKSFQLILQMSGRSGRHVKAGESPGKVVLQTYNTNHDAVRYAVDHSYLGFVENELQHRKSLNYPPYTKIASLKIQSINMDLARQFSHTVLSRCQALKEKYQVFSEIEILGPAAAPLFKLRNSFRYHLLVKSPNPNLLNQFLRRVLSDQKWVAKQVKLSIDIDPINLL